MAAYIAVNQNSEFLISTKFKIQIREITTMTKLTLEQQNYYLRTTASSSICGMNTIGYTGTEKWAIVTELAKKNCGLNNSDVIWAGTPVYSAFYGSGEVITNIRTTKQERE